MTKISRKNIAQYQVTNPNRIIDNEKARLELAESIIPELVNRADVKQDIVIWDGIEGFRKFSIKSLEQIKDGGVLYGLGSVGDLWWEQMGDAVKTYIRIKTKKRISWKLVAFVEAEKDKLGVNLSKNDFDEIRLIPQKSTPPANMVIWEDSIALQTFTPPYSVIEIKNKALAEAYLNYFNAMWDQGKKI